MKTCELTGAALNWAVAKCEAGDGLNVRIANGQLYVVGDSEIGNHLDLDGDNWQPSGNWAQGGPIIERERISVGTHEDYWSADITAGETGFIQGHGPTPLIAAMRCYVASKLGEEVEIPEKLQ